MEILMGIGVIFTIIFIFVYLHNQTSYIENNSERYNEILEIRDWYTESSETPINRIDEHYAFDTKSRYDNQNNRRKIIDAYILKNKDRLSDIVDMVNHNKELKLDYDEDVSASLKKIPPSDKYQRKEKKMVDIIIKEFSVIDRFDLQYKMSYTSPKGRNSYKCVIEYSDVELGELIDEVNTNYKEKTEHEIFRDAERAKMTAGLRYDILKRDNFMCQMCGADANVHGVTLHVDHIYPVARGGRTEEHNLQTLCQACNLGKGTKD